MDDENVATPLVESVMRMLESGPLPISEVVRRLDEHALLEELRGECADEEDLGEAVIDELLVSDAVWATPAGVVARTDRLLDGFVLTHRVTARELANGELNLCPDLVIIDWNQRDGLALAGVGRLLRVPTRVPRPGFDDSTLSGPDGWLDEFAPGDVLAFTRTADGLSVGLADVLSDDTAEVSALRASVESRLGEGEGEEAVAIVLDAVTAAPGTFRRPVRPLGELLEAAGLERRGFSFGRVGRPWRSFAERFNDRRGVQIIERYPFDDCCVESFDLVRHAYEAFDETVSDVRAVQDALAHGAAAQAFAAFVLHDSGAGDERLVRFANHILLESRGRRRAAPQYLLGIEAESRGDSPEAENWLVGASGDDPDDAGSALAQIDYAVDRGDLPRALRLIRHPGLVVEDATVAFLEDVRTELELPWRSVGRNDLCPCGTGRKFKACCAREPKIPLSARTRLLNFKLGQFARAEPRRSRIVGVASSACDPDDPNLIEQIRSLTQGSLIADFVIYDGGVAGDYLDRRGSFLPADERELVEALIDSPRALWEVVEVERGRGLVLRDTETAETIHVVERTASRQAEVGELVISRVARLPDQNQLWGSPLKVPLRLRESALALLEMRPDADALASWYGAAIAFPRIMTRERQAHGDVLDQDPEDVPEEMTRALEAYLRQRELVWLDESIPALGGLTPREAVDDPTRGEDLLSLLRELGDMNAAGANGFDADRLRGLLGLG